MIDKLNELCMWLSHQKGMMSQDYAKELAKIIVKLKQTKPLSDEEIEAVLTPFVTAQFELNKTPPKFDYLGFVRAIEERHGIK